ncbi:MAG: hypothetical protein JSU66_03290 [Deltaproteobacteria bacterium]|nr:MAG: hypothetical protein JSU66_03290 [Deltaproteobacteria bacterium]
MNRTPMPAGGTSTARQRRRLAAITALLTLLAIAILSEAVLRATGHEPWRRETRFDDEPTLHEPDPVLGWRNKPGAFVLPPFTPRGRPTRFTFLADGSRATAPEPAHGGARVVLVGGSFTQGWAIADEETFAWKLQSRNPSLHVQNHGVGGYGTYQALLLLERLFAGDAPPELVIYGFIGQHEFRNVGLMEWLEILSRHSSRGAVRVPYCSLGHDGRLVRHAPESYPPWPLRGQLASAAFLQKHYLRLTRGNRLRDGRTVTQRLLVEMKDLCEANRARLAVVMLNAFGEAADEYGAFLAAHDIPHVDCTVPLTLDRMVPGDGHPNGKLNTLFTDCIEAGIGSELTRLAAGPTPDGER